MVYPRAEAQFDLEQVGKISLALVMENPWKRTPVTCPVAFKSLRKLPQSDRDINLLTFADRLDIQIMGD